MNAYHFAVDLVERAGAKLLNTHTIVSSSKEGDARDVITNADKALNTFLIGEIKAAFPDHTVYSEEGAGSSGASEFQWMIDPIDGSANFSRGIPHFSVCVALSKDNVPQLGAVYNPITRELFSFESGHGAFLNGSPIHTTDITQVSEAQAILIVGHQPPLWDWGAAVYRSFLEHMKKTKAFGSSALDLCFLAAGRADVVVYGTLTTLDVASAIGAVRAAGGEVYSLSGEPVKLTSTRQTVVATANPTLKEAVLPLLHRELLAR